MQQQGTPRCGVVLCSSMEAYNVANLNGRFQWPRVQPLLPRRSEVSLSKTGALKTHIFWAIDGPGPRGIKRKKFRGREGGLEAD